MSCEEAKSAANQAMKEWTGATEELVTQHEPMLLKVTAVTPDELKARRDQ
jgi:hypothetical protein